MILSLIAAFDENLLIGNGNALPWKIPADMKRFRSLTMGHPVVMGSKTYQSIGKPLPGRTNIVLTRNKPNETNGVFFVSSISEAIHLAETKEFEETFFIGGASVYKLILPIVQRLYITRILDVFKGDTFFPDTIYWREWSLCNEHILRKGEGTDYELIFQFYERIMQ